MFRLDPGRGTFCQRALDLVWARGSGFPRKVPRGSQSFRSASAGAAAAAAVAAAFAPRIAFVWSNSSRRLMMSRLGLAALA